MCAPAVQARRSSDSGQSFRMISGVTPCANGLKTSSAEIRMSRTMGLPPKTSGQASGNPSQKHGRIGTSTAALLRGVLA